MRYFKTLDESGKIARLDACEINTSNGIEITKEEYESLLPPSPEINENYYEIE